mgnify:CR=1 FL=1
MKHGDRPIAQFKDQGELWHVGWDIPTRYVIDAHGHCWKDNAHGHDLEPCTNDQLLGEATDSGVGKQNALRKILNMRIPEPDWMRVARAHGWTPPKEPEK